MLGFASLIPTYEAPPYDAFPIKRSGLLTLCDVYVECFASWYHTFNVVSLSDTSPMGPQRSHAVQSFTDTFLLALEMTTLMGCLGCPPETIAHRL